MTIECPLCHKKLRDHNEFMDHLEKVHKNDDCNCGQAGGKILRDMNNFENKLVKVRDKIKKVEENMKMDAIQYGLKIGKRDVNKMPIEIREKVKSLLLENEYLKGSLKMQEKQINLMKRQINKCIDSVGIHYVIKN